MKHIQTFRKDSGFEITDRINITIGDTEEARKIIEKFTDYISAQVLANSISLEKEVKGEEWNLGEITINVKIEK